MSSKKQESRHKTVKTPPPLQEWQRRRIFGLGKRLYLDIDRLREIAAQYNGGHLHISKLNYETGRAMINDLTRQLRASNSGKWITAAQKRRIKELYTDLEWNEFEFNTWLMRFHKFPSIESKGITLKKAQNIIEGLKAMVQRKYKRENELIREARHSVPGYA